MHRRLGQVENGNTGFSSPSGHRGRPGSIGVASAPAVGGRAAPEALETEPLSGSRRPERGTGPGKRGAPAWGQDATDFQQMQQTNSVYGSQELRIEAQDILDGTGRASAASPPATPCGFRSSWQRTKRSATLWR